MSPRRRRNGAPRRTTSRQAEARLERREKDCEEAGRNIAALLKAGDAEDAEGFRLLADQQEKRGALEDQRRDRACTIAASERGGRATPNRSSAELERHRHSGRPQARGGTAGTEQRQLSKRFEQLLTERGEIRSELDRLIGEEESSKLRLERNRLLAQMAGHARDWVVLALAENLLAEAQAKFERERQPEVLSNAGDYFRRMTGGRYTKVFSPLGESELRVTDGNGQSLSDPIN